MSGSEKYRLDEQVGYLLRQASQRHAALFQSRIPHRLTPTQFAALIRPFCAPARSGRDGSPEGRLRGSSTLPSPTAVITLILRHHAEDNTAKHEKEGMGARWSQNARSLEKCLKIEAGAADDG